MTSITLPAVDAPDLELDDQLCFALYAATNAITRRYRPLLDAVGPACPQYLVLLALWTDGPGPVRRLARRLEPDPHALTPLLARLEDTGLVRRERSTDRRQVLVSPTQRGLDLRTRLRALAADLAPTSPRTSTRTSTPPRTGPRPAARAGASERNPR